jgi:hypothetical protein
MATAKAKLVSTRELGAAIDKAVALAAARHKIAVDQDNLILNGELIGRTVKPGLLNDAFADSVAAELKKGGFAVVPGTARWGKLILCGIFEKARIPQLKQYG